MVYFSAIILKKYQSLILTKYKNASFIDKGSLTHLQELALLTVSSEESDPKKFPQIPPNNMSIKGLLLKELNSKNILFTRQIFIQEIFTQLSLYGRHNDT